MAILDSWKMTWSQCKRDKEGKTERQQHKTFSLDKLECLTAAGSNTEVRNKINKGGSWHQRSPSARVCCSDDRQGELKRYDAVVCCTASPCCSAMMVTMLFQCSPGLAFFPCFFTRDTTRMAIWSLSSLSTGTINSRTFYHNAQLWNTLRLLLCTGLYIEVYVVHYCIRLWDLGHIFFLISIIYFFLSDK